MYLPEVDNLFQQLIGKLLEGNT
uniref:Uncharacterized protein n=1 Tax=Lepeophtheirus salmonis TaxID=72036 RepID=A0A0K2UAI8_LEPSM